MKPVTREFQDEVLAVLLCWWLFAAHHGDVALRQALSGSLRLKSGDAKARAWRAVVAADRSRASSIQCYERAIATVERWPVLP